MSRLVKCENGHFYDADKLNSEIIVRMAKNGEKLTTLDNIERTLTSDDIVISNGKEAIGLAGVMGGLDTEITENTKNVLVEAEIFNQVKVRKNAQYIVRSEASNRFEKGLDPNRTYMAAERAVKLLEEYANGTVVGGTVEYNKEDMSDKVIEITYKNGIITKISKQFNPNVNTEVCTDTENHVLITVGNDCVATDPFDFQINLSDSADNSKIEGVTYLITTTNANNQVRNEYVTTNADGQINTKIYGTGNLNIKVTEQSPLLFVQTCCSPWHQIKKTP